MVPGGGTFGMEAVARQFASNKKCLVLRNGWFSYRWSQILEMGEITSSITVMKAKKLSSSKENYDSQSPMEPASIDEVLKQIDIQKPNVVFAPHVETSAGMILPDEYIASVAQAVHKAGGLFVLDCIALELYGWIWRSSVLTSLLVHHKKGGVHHHVVLL